MKLTIFEGTSEEYLRIAETLHPQKSSPAKHVEVKDLVPTYQERESGKRYVTSEEATRILLRRPLSKNIYAVLFALYNAKGISLTSKQLQELNAHNADEFRGMMGAFGRRVVNTIGSRVNFFEREWDFESYQYRWSLPESTRQGIEESGIFD